MLHAQACTSGPPTPCSAEHHDAAHAAAPLFSGCFFRRGARNSQHAMDPSTTAVQVTGFDAALLAVQDARKRLPSGRFSVASLTDGQSWPSFFNRLDYGLSDCANCDDVPCGQCQEGCPPSLNGCDPRTPGMSSRNGCSHNNSGSHPSGCTIPDPLIAPLPDLERQTELSMAKFSEYDYVFALDTLHYPNLPTPAQEEGYATLLRATRRSLTMVLPHPDRAQHHAAYRSTMQHTDHPGIHAPMPGPVSVDPTGLSRLCENANGTATTVGLWKTSLSAVVPQATFWYAHKCVFPTTGDKGAKAGKACAVSADTSALDAGACGDDRCFRDVYVDF